MEAFSTHCQGSTILADTVIRTIYSKVAIDKNNTTKPQRITTNTPLTCTSILMLFLLSFSWLTAADESDLLTRDDFNKDVPDPCGVCKLVVESFEKGMEDTARGKHEGGDTSWEEKNLKSYQDSEIRLVEIQEQLCLDTKNGKAQCLALAEDTESEIEDWWFNHRRKNVRLHDYLCINKLKRCCPEGKFGPNCQKCPSDCNKHGDCDGSGTRNGTGKCDCYSGYTGDDCERCSQDHFRMPTNDQKFTCLKCDQACDGCHGPGPLNCTECRFGYQYQERDGCVDINECDVGVNNSGDTRLCKGNTYCVNTDGYYKCAECHEACSGCLGYGADKCIQCAPGYQLDDGHFCRTEDEIEQLQQYQTGEISGSQVLVLAKILYDIGYIISIGVLLYYITLDRIPFYVAVIHGVLIATIINMPFFFWEDLIPPTSYALRAE